MRSLVFAAVALAFSVSPALAGTTGNGWSQRQAAAPATDPPPATGPYKLDAKGKCHDSLGKIAPREKCGTGVGRIANVRVNANGQGIPDGLH